jgi:GNAT superfamily N-acetyltransferase
MKIQKAIAADFETVAPLFDQYRQFYNQASDLESAKEFIKNRLERRESVIFYVCDEAGEGIGFAQLYPSFSSISMKRLWVLNDLFVTPSARKSSLGRALLQKALEFSKETKAKGLTLKTAVDNIPAQKLYETEGWKREDKFCSYNIS